jgi:protein SCO1
MTRALFPRALRFVLATLPALLLALAVPRPVCALAPDTSGIGYTQRLGAALPLTSKLVAQDGRPATLGTVIGGKPTLLVLGYFACPSLCGVIREDLFSALANTSLRAARDYNLVFLSIDPAERPADANAAFTRDLALYPTKNADAGWHFMTADRPTIGRIETAVGYHSRFDTSLKQFLHPAGVVVLTPAGQVSSYLLGVGYQAGAVQAALGQARAGTVGQQAPAILLLCFHYDPSTGRYSLAIMKVLRLAGLLTVLTIAGLLLLLRRQGRRA